ncbi:Cobalamin (vitamin B12) biosynthesis CbiB [human gut metagenome]|uniref:Cobalamin (Vitamin B12) biosynthesis CbiB n=1 Tax=human gut metagenome TaxID=408170 RepID=K1SP33_9ZZZZ
MQKQDLPAARKAAARKAVARIVGRDTQNLTAEGVTKAAVETVAENASDGVIAPLLYMLLGGAPLALTYKAINTMDSMLGYKTRNTCILAVPPPDWTMPPTICPAAWPGCCGWPLPP